MNHCLVFGARGHLAQTRIIPALEKIPCPYTPISRKEVANLKHIRFSFSRSFIINQLTNDHLDNSSPLLEGRQDHSLL